MLIIYIFHICEFSPSPKFIGHPQINILGAFGDHSWLCSEWQKIGVTGYTHSQLMSNTDSVFLPYFNSHSINKDLFHSVVSGMFSTSLVCVCVCVCVYVCDSAI